MTRSTATSAPRRPVPPLAGKLPPHCERDLSALRRFVRAAVTGAAPARAVAPSEIRRVLVTGATGFVGRFLVRDLLAHDAGLQVHCLVRAASADEGLDRLRASMEHAEIWDDDFAPRIHVRTGDIAQPRLGLSRADFDNLCANVDAVYHLAATLSLAASYAGIRSVNASSLRNVLELCLRTRRKHLFYAGTMGIFPEYVCTFAHEYEGSRIAHQGQPDLASMKKTFPLGLLGYPWSKLVAEQALLFAQSAGLPVAVFRLGQTSMATTGYSEPNNITQRLFAAAVDIGSAPAGFTLQSANDPVDTLSRICTGISLNPERRFTLYNCCNPTPSYRTVSLEEIGLDLPEVSYRAFKRACQARGDASPMAGYWPVLDHFGRYWLRGTAAATTLPISDRAIREDCPGPIEWPGPLTCYVRHNRWVRLHREDWPHPQPRRSLDFDRLVKQARRYAGENGVSFEDTYPEWMFEGLEQLVDALNSPDAGLPEDRVGHIAFDMCRLLRNNAELARERLRHPAIERQEIVRPVFIVGINRTGTTYLHRLMARDPRFWTLRAYEYVEPVIAAGDDAGLAGTSEDPRRALAADVFKASGIIDSFAGTHHVGLDEPEEDMPILRLSFRAWMFATRHPIPTYERWLEARGSRESYALHRRVMQHYTWQRRERDRGAGGQWLFKMPTHLRELEALIEAYPDALFIQTHREPAQFMGSWCSLVERIRADVSSPRPPDELGAEQLRAMSCLLDRAVAFRESRPELDDRWIDVSYYDLVQDPTAVVAHVYDRCGWSLRPEVVAAMEDWLDEQSERRRTEKRHTYDIADYGLTQETIDDAFVRYRDFLSGHSRRASLL
jgi:thioester reductase-like protein